ncbi:MAG: hypothetical protein DKT66_16785 [Candidatus Melainabacteria bacterium]|nr:MAG: hypothetical protein DKT66_16785 [Candidatus Melainabacteria bacterium]
MQALAFPKSGKAYNGRKVIFSIKGMRKPVLPADDKDDDHAIENEPQTQTEAGGDSGGKSLTRIGGGTGGNSGGGKRRFRQFGNFDPRADVPRGEDFVEQIRTCFHDLTPSALKKIFLISTYDSLPVEEEQLLLTQLRENPSAGGSVFRLSVCNERLIAWIVKDFALDLASLFQNEKTPDLDSLLFVELFVRAEKAFTDYVLAGPCNDVNEFTPVISSSMTDVYSHFYKLGVSRRLYKLLKYRSMENELMQNREERLTELDLANAMKISVRELQRIKRWNRAAFGQN